ncbi:hypothetical protein MSAN_01172500 [Mycena sanguinolenta]|uniref:Uncharacterized protein n=1 Tax=Mycena sanguinolenta TaxID=230812 RepID=A0A8H6YLU7_9AGAR|nr:hypothetical protein MSAN_01172500 [Mycena sanguinolenta]
MPSATEIETPHWKAATTANKPSWVLPGPFDIYAEEYYTPHEWVPTPKTVYELLMYQLSWAIRSKPDWQRKATDPEIRRKWHQEALQQQASKNASEEACLTEKMVDYVLAELDGYAKIADNERGIERACFEAIWHSDRLISNDLLENLKSAAKTLEDVPEGGKDWHPGSNNQVLDLVHPSLYCVVYGRTHAYLPNKPRIATNYAPVQAPEPSKWASPNFSWLPSDFTVDGTGSVKLASPYINNLHPVLHRPTYDIIEQVLSAFVPMFERVLGDFNREHGRVPFSTGDRLEQISCIFKLQEGLRQPEDMYDDEWFAYLDTVPKTLPQGRHYNGHLEAQFMPVSLRGRTIQCIIKLANIHLTPEQPEYAGGSWHVEGMLNERIVASGIYYYDEENVTESKLSFRIAVDNPEYHGQDDGQCMRMLYNMESDGDLVQELGAVVTKPGRALSWPNLFQHRVSPFKLVDPSKPGHRKILAFFLVDPTKDPILSATDVPPQRADWAAEALEAACVDSTSLLGEFPRELRDLVKDNFPPTLISAQEAEVYRAELMKERTASVESHTRQYLQSFNLCEH